MNDNANKLYSALKDFGYEDLGDEKQFTEKLKDPSSRDKLYNALSRDGFEDVGTLDDFNLKLGYSSQLPPEQTKKTGGFWDSFIGDATEMIGAGTTRLIGSTAGLLNKGAQAINNVFGSSGGLFGDIQNSMKDTTEDMAKKADRYNGKSYSKLWKEGDYTGALGDIVLKGAESLPMSIAAIVSGPVSGLAGIGAITASDKYDELDENKPMMGELAKITNSILTGSAEALSEKLGAGATKLWMKSLYKTMGKEAAKQAVQTGVMGMIKSNFKKYGILYEPLMEGVEEVSSQLAENITDKMTGADPSRDLKDGLFDSFVYGVGGGAYFSAAGVPGAANRQYDKIKTNHDWRKAKQEYISLFPDDANDIEGINSFSAEDGEKFLSSITSDSSMSEERKAVAVNLIKSNMAYRARRTPEAIKQDKEAREKLMIQAEMRNYDRSVAPISADNGMIQQVYVNGDMDNPVYITKGSTAVMQNDNGEEVFDSSKSDEKLYYQDKEGKMQVISPSQVSGIGSIRSVVDSRAQYEADIRTQFDMQEQLSQQEQQQEIENGDDIVYVDNSGKQATGRVVDAFSNPEYVFLEDGSSVPRGLVAKAPMQNMEVPEEQNHKINAQNTKEDVSTNSTTGTGEETSEMTLEKLMPTLPKTKDGKIDYKQLTTEQRFQYTSLTDGAEIAVSDVQNDIVALNEDIQKLKDKEAKVRGNERISVREELKQRRMELDELSALLPSVQPVSDNSQETDKIIDLKAENETILGSEQSNPSEIVVPDASMNDKEFAEWALDESDSTDDLLSAYDISKKLSSVEDNLPRWQQELLGKKINPGSFYTFGDRNKVNGAFAKAWLKKDGVEIDTFADELSEYGMPVTPEDIITFMLDNPTNYMRKTSDLQNNIARKWSEVATREAGVPISGPESATGKVFVAMKKNGSVNPLEYESAVREESVTTDDTQIEEFLSNWYAELSVQDNNNSAKDSNFEDLWTKDDYEDIYQAIDNELNNNQNDTDGSRDNSETEEDRVSEDRIGENEQSSREEDNPGSDTAPAGPDRSFDSTEITEREAKALDVLVKDFVYKGYFDETIIMNGDNIQKDSFIESLIGIAQGAVYRMNTGVIPYGMENKKVFINKARDVIWERYERLTHADPNVEGITEAALTQLITEAEQQVDTNPTEAQKEAGNYKKGHIKLNGFDITIENPAGSIRSGKDASGKEWSVTMQNTYGYIRGTEGVDGDHIDVFLGDGGSNVYVVDQVNQDGLFDEHKVMYGFSSMDEAREAYLANYSPGWKGLGEVTEVSKEGFKKWVDSSRRKTKAFAEYRISKDNSDNEGIRFREVGDITSFASKYNLDEADVRSYSKYMMEKNLSGSALAFGNIKRNMRLANNGQSLKAFIKMFYPVKAELYEKFGNVDELLDEYKRREMEKRGMMEAARKRVEQEAEAERKRQEEFELMTGAEMDTAYFVALEAGNESRTRDIVNEAARRNGYVLADEFRMAHRAPTYDEEGHDKSMVDIAANKDQIRESLNEQLRMNRDKYRDESAAAINDALSTIDKGGKSTVTIYRSVPKSLKEGKVRNGDWVSLSESYVKVHGEHTFNGDYRIMKEEVPAENLYWDGNDINEWGYDDKRDYRYKDTKNNRKSNDLITRDDKGDVIPLSKRFNSRKADTRFRFIGEKADRIEKLRNSKPVEITGEEYNGKYELNRDSVKEWMKNNLRGEYSNLDTGEIIEVRKDGVQKVTSHSMGSIAHLKSIIAIPDMIEKSIFIEEVPNTKDNGKYNSYRYYVCGLNIGGIDYTAKVTVGVKGASKYYDHALTQIEKGTLLNNIDALSPTFDFEKSSSPDIKDTKLLSILQTEKEKITTEVEKLSSSLNTTVHIIRDVNDIVDEAVGQQTKKRGSKGWYDPKTGEVYFVLPNAESVEDAQATILHEVVAHKGLRGMLGEHFSLTMETIFDSLPEEIQTSLMDEFKNKSASAEEYCAHMAETMSDPGIVQRICSALKNVLRKIGIDLKVTDGDIMYMLWKSKNRLGDNDTAFDIMDKVVKEQSVRTIGKEYDELFRSKKPINKLPVSIEKKIDVTHDLQSKTERLYEGYVDRMISAKKLQDLIVENTGKPIPDYMNVWMYENTLSSRNGYEIAKCKEIYGNRLKNSIKKLTDAGLSERDVDTYVLAKHGLERNEYMRMKTLKSRIDTMNDDIKSDLLALIEDKTFGEISEIKNDAISDIVQGLANKDYSGLTAIKKELGDKSIEEFITETEAEFKSEITGLLNSIKAINDFSLKKWFDSGMINRSSYERIGGMFKNYVPLRGFDETMAHDVYEYYTETGSSFNNPLKKMDGRTSRADSPFPHMISMVESSIVGGNKNLMKLHLYRMAQYDASQEKPSGKLSIVKQWYTYKGIKADGVEEWGLSIPEYADNIEEYRENVEKHEKEMLLLESEGKATRKPEKLKIGYVLLPIESEEHIVDVKLNGERYQVLVHGNPKVAQAVNGLNDESRPDKWYLKTIAWTNRQMAANFTTRNPAFVFSNLSRDLIWSTTALSVKENRKYRNRFLRNIPRASGALARMLRGNQDFNNPVDVMLNEFLKNGGRTGYTALYSIEKYKKEIHDSIKTGKWTKTKKGYNAVLDFMQLPNEWAEDLSRFSTYMTSRQEGRTVLQSVSDAKEVTVNFNRKGSGAYGAGALKGIFLFFNAAVQSLNNSTKLTIKNKIGATVALGSFGIAGLIIPAILSMLGADDDQEKYNGLPDYIRKNNICIPLGWCGIDGFLKIPLPIELRAFYGMGDAVYRAWIGEDEVGYAFSDVGMGLLDLLPLNPAGGTSNYFPDAIKPVLESYVFNEDFTGKPIAKITPFNEYDPEYERVYKSASVMPVTVSEYLNIITGGDEAKRGWYDDVLSKAGTKVNPSNPAALEHLFEAYFGGMFTTLNQTFKTAVGAPLGLNEFSWRNVPVFNRFYDTGEVDGTMMKVNEKYFDYLDEMKESKNIYRKYEKLADDSPALESAQYMDKFSKYEQSDEWKRTEFIEDYAVQINDFMDELKEATDEKYKDELQKEINLLKKEMVNGLKKGKVPE